MALANDSILVTPGTGATVATHLASAKEYQAVVLADDGGHIVGTRDAYRLFVPISAVGVSKVHVDLFNATGSGNSLRIVQARVFPITDVAATGVLGAGFFLTRTSAVGTTGTAAALESVSLTAASINKFNPASAALNANITARLAPGGGATAGATLGYTQVFTEETGAGAHYAAAAGGNLLHDAGYDWVVPEASGIRIVQGAVASVGSVAFVIDFVLA